MVETTALGAAMLAGLAVGFWKGPEEVKETGAKSAASCRGWQNASAVNIIARWREAVGRHVARFRGKACKINLEPFDPGPRDLQIVEQPVDLLLQLPERRSPVFGAQFLQQQPGPVELGMGLEQHRRQFGLQADAGDLAHPFLQLSEPFGRLPDQSDLPAASPPLPDCSFPKENALPLHQLPVTIRNTHRSVYLFCGRLAPACVKGAPC